MSNIKQKIQLKIDKQGNVQVVDVIGAGAGCQSLTSDLEKALGIVDEKSRESTAAAYQDVDPLKLTVEGQ
jgi:hypothetical protein